VIRWVGEVGEPEGRKVGRSEGRKVGRSEGRKVGKSESRKVGRSVRQLGLRREPALRRLPDLRSLGEEGCEGGRRSLVGLDGLPSVAFLTFVASAKKVAKGGRSEGNANFKSVPRLGGQSRIIPPGPALGRTTNTPMTSSRRNPWRSLVRLSRTIVHGLRTFPKPDRNSGSAAPMSRRDFATQPWVARNEEPRINPANRS
jgi:hypothetical protein